MKEEIFSKFRDYNRELEKILEKKDFSQDTKNLLLSMFYKIEISYHDYYTVKRKSKTKQAYLENILDNIKQCNKIELIEPSDEQFDELKANNNLYSIDFKLKTIKALANELVLLSAILELNNFEIHLNEEYNLIRNSMPYLLNTAYDMENLEVLRDFNAWSWNTQFTELKDININLIYQCLKIALDVDIFSIMQNENGYIDVIQTMKQILLEKYEQKTVEKLMQLVFKLSIIIYIQKSDNENKRLYEERQVLQTELEEMKDKKKYIEKITQKKRELSKELKEKDLILKDKDLLVKEYEKRNNLLSEYNKIFSISHLVEKLQRERTKLLDKIDLYNKKMEPQTYLDDMNKQQEDYNLLKDIDFSNPTMEKEIEELQKFFLEEIFAKKIELAKSKNEIIDVMYELRYYNFLAFSKQEMMQDVKDIKVILQKLEENLVKKLYDNKLINNISTNEHNDIEIVKNIFNLKIISREDIYVEIKKNENYLVIFYDEKETLEKEIELNLQFNKKDRIKLNRKIKLFFN